MKSNIASYIHLTKPKVILLFAITGFAAIVVEGSLLAQPLQCILVVFAILLTAGSANALNMYFDRDIDKQMERTKGRRPIPLQKIAPEKAAIFGVVLGAIAVAYLLFAVNKLSAALSLFTILFYVAVYTLWLKRRTPYNIVIGGAAGATAPLIGWAAATGSISALAWVLFLIIFFWTPPHFWALAIAIKEDYEKVNIPMLPVTHGEKRTRIEIFIYTVLLIPISMAPYFLHSAGRIYLFGTAGLNLFYLWKTLVMMHEKTKASSKKLFWISIFYLFLLFVLLMVDRLLLKSM